MSMRNLFNNSSHENSSQDIIPVIWRRKGHVDTAASYLVAVLERTSGVTEMNRVEEPKPVELAPVRNITPPPPDVSNHTGAGALTSAQLSYELDAQNLTETRKYVSQVFEEPVS